MADTPIPKQSGLTQEELDSMKTTKQKYKEYYGDQKIKTKTLEKFKGVSISSQQSSLKNILKECLVTYTEQRESIDNSDEYAMDNCIKDFADNLADTFVKVVQCQKVSIKTSVTTTDVTVGTLANPTGLLTFTQIPSVNTGSGDGEAKPEQVIIK